MNNRNPQIAYLCLEFGLNKEIKSYAGGLGILAGDTLKSASDLGKNLVGVTLLYKKGYFKQVINEDGKQVVLSDDWDYENYLECIAENKSLKIGDHNLFVTIWRYTYHGEQSTSDIYFFDTDLEVNSEGWRRVSHHLYPGNIEIKLQQELVLAYASVYLLPDLGITPDVFHLNESHAALAIIPIIKTRGDKNIKQSLVFTTHTPIPAGHEKHHLDSLRHFVGDDLKFIDQSLCNQEALNLTELALHYSSFVNAVSRKHREVTNAMYPEYRFNYITNGVHPLTWIGEPKMKLFDIHIPDWRINPHLLRQVVKIPNHEFYQAHLSNKIILCDLLNSKKPNLALDPQKFTIGCARRAAQYKRINLIFTDFDRLQAMSDKFGGIQLVFSGKAHPDDEIGQETIREIYHLSQQTNNSISIHYMEDYNIDISKLLVSGVDLWLNNPIVPLEASGTSGMKASMNGIPSLSTLDGWWIEGWIEGVTGWAIGNGEESKQHEILELEDLYHKLEYEILPIYHHDHQKWLQIQKDTVAINGSYFSSHRMLYEYYMLGYINSKQNKAVE